MKINREKRSIEFNNVKQSKHSINDIESTVKVADYSFINENSKGDFRQINSIDDLEKLHKDGEIVAKNTFTIMNKK